MATVGYWHLTNEDKDRMIAALTPELTILRTKADISQEELSELIGISRQTYSAIERGKRPMAWSTFLSLVMFFDINKNTHSFLKQLEAIPQQIYNTFNAEIPAQDISLENILGEGGDTVISSLDEQALRSIRTLIMIEYARCTSTSGNIIIKYFDGVNFTLPKKADAEASAEKALKAIKEKNKKHDKP